MASATRRETSTLTELVLKQHDSVNVFQLMRLLLAGQDPSWPIEKRLRFRADLSAAFPAREFSRVTVRKAAASTSYSTPTPLLADKKNKPHGQVIDISTANYCVASILGPLPEPFTEWVRDLERARDPAMADFFNIFNQRLNVMRYKLKSATTIGLNSRAPAETPHAHALAALMGLGLPKLASQVPLHPRAWLGLAGLLSNTRRCASTVTHVLSLFLQTKVTLQPMVGAWQQIEPEDRIALGQRNQILGQRSVLGQRVWDQQARVKLRIGPVSYQRLCQLLPPNRAEQRATLRAGQPNEANTSAKTATPFQSLIGLLRLLLDGLVDCEVELEIDEATIPNAILASRSLAYSLGGSKMGMRLGQTAWLHKPWRYAGMPVMKLQSPSQSRHRERSISYLVRAYNGPEKMEAA